MCGGERGEGKEGLKWKKETPNSYLRHISYKEISVYGRYAPGR